MKILPIQLAKIFSRKDAAVRNGRFLENIARAYLHFAFSAAFHFAFCGVTRTWAGVRS
jgi:uncharacterized membrane protein YagU involved in acid resistance